LDALGGEADIPRATGAFRFDENDPSKTLAAKFAVMHKAAFVFTSGGDAASAFASADQNDGLGEEPCARWVLFYSVSQ
jgi:hypothetical protein